MLSESGQKIIDKVLQMNDVQLASFIRNLSQDDRDYLDILLRKHLGMDE